LSINKKDDGERIKDKDRSWEGGKEKNGRTAHGEGKRGMLLKVAFNKSFDPELTTEGFPSSCSGPELVEQQAI
jgi:hypothetical protein